ncbi:glycosyltransferase family 4 protein [Brachybacterium sp. GCM10030252]|uniref:glycosyltransferase family 4 protein n=1 Tax=Brachybacterium sp. GCM10030252 TaxID=3273380 RepID=UPI0036064ED6
MTLTPQKNPPRGPQLDGERPLRIGMIAPPWFELPPRAYGGTEAVVATLVDQLVARGHEVTLIGAGKPGTLAQDYVQVYPEAPSHLLGRSVLPELTLAAEARRALAEREVDIVHDHSAAGPLLAAGRGQPTVVTMHGPVAGDNGDYYRRLGTDVDVVAISDAQRRQAPELNWVGTVHNAIDVPDFPFQDRKDDIALWMGRFTPDKGPDLAIEAARRAGRKLILAGKLREESEKAYFDEVIRPRLGRHAEYVGEANADFKRELFARASCLVFPIRWEEPFGMVMAEALACGTPVIATPRGSVPEIVRDGHNGFLATGVEALAAAIERSGEISAQECRRDALERFDLPVMAAGYERIYRMLVEGGTSIEEVTRAIAR